MRSRLITAVAVLVGVAGVGSSVYYMSQTGGAESAKGSSNAIKSKASSSTKTTVDSKAGSGSDNSVDPGSGEGDGSPGVSTNSDPKNVVEAIPAPTASRPRSDASLPGSCAGTDKLVDWNGCPVFQDEFAGNAVDEGANGWGVYDFNSDVKHPRVRSNLSVSGGSMRLTGIYDTVNRPQLGLGAGVQSRFQQKYGRFEVRARADKGSGFAATSLLWPDRNLWPTNGEIDIFEITKAERQSFFTATHNGADNAQRSRFSEINANDWHTYAVEWVPGKVSFFVDDRAIWSSTNPTVIPSTSRMHMTLQMDPGCDAWYTCADASTPASQTMYVDYVKAWSYSS